MDARAKEKIISNMYYNTTSGFGSIDETIRQVKQIDKSITKAEVTQFLDNQDIRQTKRPKGYNCFIPEGPLEQIQIDLADFGQAQSEFRYGLVAIDVFTKHLDVIPIKGKTSVETSNGLDQVLIHLGHPASVLTD